MKFKKFRKKINKDAQIRIANSYGYNDIRAAKNCKVFDDKKILYVSATGVNEFVVLIKMEE